MIARLYQSPSWSNGKPLPPHLVPLPDPARRFSHSFRSVAGRLGDSAVLRVPPHDPHYHGMNRRNNAISGDSLGLRWDSGAQWPRRPEHRGWAETGAAIGTKGDIGYRSRTSQLARRVFEFPSFRLDR